MRTTKAVAATAMLSLSLLATPAIARDPANVLMPTDPQALSFQEAVGYADAVVTGDTIYLSGVIAAPEPGEEGLAPAFDRAFAAIGATLARAGAGWDDVVDLTTYHTDLAGQINAFAEVKNRYIKAPFPAWTAIGITALYEPTGVVEIKVTARRPKD